MYKRINSFKTDTHNFDWHMRRLSQTWKALSHKYLQLLLNSRSKYIRTYIELSIISFWCWKDFCRCRLRTNILVKYVYTQANMSTLNYTCLTLHPETLSWKLFSGFQTTSLNEYYLNFNKSFYIREFIILIIDGWLFISYK